MAFLDQLADLADGFASRMALVQALTDIVDALPADSPRIALSAGTGSAPELSRLTGVQVSEERSLVRLAMLRLGPNFPAVLVRGGPRLVIYDRRPRQRGLIDLGQAVPAVLDALGAELPQLRQLLPPADEAAAGRDLSAFVGAVVTELLAAGQPRVGLAATAGRGGAHAAARRVGDAGGLAAGRHRRVPGELGTAGHGGGGAMTGLLPESAVTEVGTHAAGDPGFDPLTLSELPAGLPARLRGSCPAAWRRPRSA